MSEADPKRQKRKKRRKWIHLRVTLPRAGSIGEAVSEPFDVGDAEEICFVPRFEHPSGCRQAPMSVEECVEESADMQTWRDVARQYMESGSETLLPLSVVRRWIRVRVRAWR